MVDSYFSESKVPIAGTCTIKLQNPKKGRALPSTWAGQKVSSQYLNYWRKTHVFEG